MALAVAGRSSCGPTNPRPLPEVLQEIGPLHACRTHGEKSSGEVAVPAQPRSSTLGTRTEGSGIRHKVPFQMGTGLRLLSSLFKLREQSQNLSSGEEQIVTGKNKWGKTEALGRGEGAKQGKEHPVSIPYKGQGYIPICLLLLSYFSLSHCYSSPHLFPASSSDSFEIIIKMDI